MKQIESFYLPEMRRARTMTFLCLFFFITGIYSSAFLAGIAYTNIPAIPENLEKTRTMIAILFPIVVAFFPVIIFDYRQKWLEAKKKVYGLSH